ncbi:hepatitis A virus cellular receptor 1-like [Choloepus didactylus]|uniref:hepatitis A virus cellular receptor 1-like n=1 Tax=Choloepus didactylus TaxID=27675 RepID=UPI0018A06DDC|nr:hepatitis A virus cellular receptor 1-like [Choloepus didactylus]
MCWGQVSCPLSGCSNELIWMNGSHAIFQRYRHYKLKGKLLEENVSLTIENANEIDNGLYCCCVEYRGWFNDKKLTLSLEIKPAMVTSVPTSPEVSTSAPPTPATTQSHRAATSPSPKQPATTHFKIPQEMRRMQPTSSLGHHDTSATSPFLKQLATTHFKIPQEMRRTQPTSSPGHHDTSATSPFLKQPATTHFKIPQEMRRMQPTSSPGHHDTSDGNGTVTQYLDGLWHGNQTGVSLVQEPWMTTTNGVYIGIGIFAAVLLSLLVVMIIKWFHSMALTLELYEEQLKTVSKQKTISTLLRTISTSWTKIQQPTRALL